MWAEILRQYGNAMKRWLIPFFIHPFIFFTLNQLCWQCFSACTRFYENKARLVNLLFWKTLKLKASYSSLKVLREQKMYAGLGWRVFYQGTFKRRHFLGGVKSLWNWETLPVDEIQKLQNCGVVATHLGNFQSDSRSSVKLCWGYPHSGISLFNLKGCFKTLFL